MSAKIFRCTAGLAAILGLASCLGGCGDGEGRDAQLLSGKKADLSAEEERIQKLMKIRVWDENDQTWTEKTASELTGYFFSLYRGKLVQTPGSDLWATDRCIGYTHGFAGAHLKVAIGFNKVARSLIPVELYSSEGPGGGGGELTLRIPAQDHTARVALYYAARRAAILAMESVVDLIVDPSAALSYDCNESQIAGEQAAEVFTLAYDLYVDSTKGAIESTTIAADVLKSRAPSETEGNIWRYSAREFSRTAASHLLAGAYQGWMKDTDFEPFCSRAPLGPTARRALEVLRMAAPYPGDVLNSDISIESFLGGTLSGTGTAPAVGSISDRLGEYMPQLDLSTLDIPTATNLSLDDYREARGYMQRELNTMMRTWLPLPLDPGRTYARYAGTASEAKPVPDATYAALTRYKWWRGVTPGQLMLPSSGSINFDALDSMSDPGLDLFKSNTIQTIAGMLPMIDAAIANQPAEYRDRLDDGMKSPFVALLDRLKSQTWGAVIMDYEQNSSGDWAFIIALETKTANPPVSFVYSVDGLRCMKDGSIEGVPCALDTYLVPMTLVSSFPDPNSVLGYWQWYEIGLTPGLYPTAPVFVVDHTSGVARVVYGATMTTAPEAPTEHGGSSYVFEESNSEIAQLVSMNSEWCGETQHDCLGNNVRERLPLENELSKDEVDVESSWKHYLLLARQAAAEAEFRGNDYLNAALDVERRKEEIWKDRDTRARQAIEQLQQTCGTAMDPARLLQLLSGGELAPPASTACTTTSDCNPATGAGSYQCLAGQCVIDFNRLMKIRGELDPEMRRLAECVDSGMVPFSALGDRPLCIWVDDVNPNKVCAGTNSSMECPVPKKSYDSSITDPDVACADVTHPVGTHRELIWGDGLLRYFPVKIEEGNSTNTLGPKAKACTALREIRGSLDSNELKHGGTTTTVTRDEIEERLGSLIVKSMMFHPGNYDVDTSGYRSTLHPMGNISISHNGRELWTTGKIGLEGRTPSTNWPCGPVGRPPECTSSDVQVAGLFCDYVDCSDPRQRGQMVDRLHYATWALSGMRSTSSNAPVWDGFYYPEVSSQNGYPECHVSTTWETVPREGLAPLRIESCPPNNGKGQNGLSWRRIWVDGNADDRVVWYGSHDWVKLGTLKPEDDRGEYLEDPTTGPFIRLNTGGYAQIQRLGSATSAKWSSALNGLSTMNSKTPESAEGWAKDLIVRVMRGEEQVTRGVSKTENGYSFGTASFLDALEMHCQALSGGSFNCGDKAPPSITSPSDLPLARKYLECVADGITARAGRTILAQVPTRAMDALRKTSAIGSFPLVGGEFGAAVSRLRESLVILSDIAPAIASELRQMSEDIEVIRVTLELNSIQQDMSEIQMYQGMTSALSNCVSFNPAAIPGCALGLAQIGFLQQLNKLQTQVTDFSAIKDFAQFRSQLESRSRTLTSYGSRISSALEDIDAELAILDGLRLRAQRMASDALYAATWGAPNSEAIGNTLTWKYNEARRRYEQSTKVARILAIIARRAIEQRLGTRLVDLHDDLPLVEAPSTWVDKICEAEGLSFEDISESVQLGTVENGAAETATSERSFLGTYVADYVARLERTVESYRMTYPFQEGVDEAVASMRNDLARTKATCTRTSPNLVSNSSQLDLLTGTDNPGTGWKVDECPSVSTTSYAACLQVSAVPARTTSSGRIIQPYALNFDMSKCESLGCTVNTDPLLGTTLTLEAGWYNLNYLVMKTSDTAACDVEPVLLDASEAWVPWESPTSADIDITPGQVPALVRRSRRARVISPGTYKLAFWQTVPNLCTESPVGARTVALADVMLTRQSSSDWGADVVPPFVSSDANAQVSGPYCEDVDGTNFRLSAWSDPKCVRLCDDGYADSCNEASGRLACYREIRFSMDESRFENDELFQGSGIAKGNFNYRIEQVGVNFVGTGIKFCDSSVGAASCYGNANVQYSIEHLGPFYVRNYTGDDVESKLFNGRIEHARGLAAERYLTNPLSSGDRALMTPYMRNEFQGRPLGGEYVLKVWQSPEVEFENIEDVQLFLRYRYWTRQN